MKKSTRQILQSFAYTMLGALLAASVISVFAILISKFIKIRLGKKDITITIKPTANLKVVIDSPDTTLHTPDETVTAQSIPVPNVPTESVRTSTPTEYVYVSTSGNRYHKISNCGTMQPTKAKPLTLDEAEAKGYKKCTRCF